MAVDLPVGFWP